MNSSLCTRLYHYFIIIKGRGAKKFQRRSYDIDYHGALMTPLTVLPYSNFNAI